MSPRESDREWETANTVVCARLRSRFPGVNERLSHGAPCFFVQDKRPLCYYHDDHHGDGRISLWCPAPPGVPEELVGAEPERFFEPTPSASGTFQAGWACSSTRQVRTRLIGLRSPPSSRMHTARWHPRISSPNSTTVIDDDTNNRPQRTVLEEARWSSDGAERERSGSGVVGRGGGDASPRVPHH